nr:site-specific integrase [Endozoicomonas sp.]
MKPKYLTLVKQHSGIYYLSGTLNGKRIRETTGTTDKAQAMLMAVHKELEALQLATGAKGYLNPNFCQCVRRYEKEVKYSRKNQGIVDRLSDFFGASFISDIAQDEVDEFVREHFVGLASSTVERNLTIFQAIRNHAVKSKLVDQESLPYIHVERTSKHVHRMHVVSQETRDEIISLARQPYRDVFTFLFYTGARIGCALSRTWDDRCSPGMRLYTVKGGRGKLRQRREYFVPETPELTAMLDCRARQGVSAGEKIFSVSDTAVRDELARITALLGIEDFLPHDIRHCFGTYLARDKVGIETIADLMGHDSLESTRKYINHARDDLARQMRGALSKPVVGSGLGAGYTVASVNCSAISWEGCSDNASS